MKWAVFLDRDGTVIEEVDHLSKVEEVRLIPGAAQGIRLLNETGVPVILVTNQSVIGRGYLTEAGLAEIHQELARQLATYGAHLDAVYYCPHHPDEHCECRKPAPALLIMAAHEHGIDLSLSFIVGDKLCDLEAGRRVGCRIVLVLTGYGVETREAIKRSDFQLCYIGKDLLDAVRWILSR